MRFLVWRALAGLLVFDTLRLGCNFAKIHHFVSTWPVAERGITENVVQQVCVAVNTACVWYPKRVRCLQRSTVTTCLLRSTGIPAKMVMGAQILPVSAHAWTEVNGKPINERRDVQRIYGVWERC
jgi:hypothetical protein